MKKSIQIIATALVMLFGNAALGQNDTMYVMKNGVVISEQSVNPSDVDSIIFYRPNTSSVEYGEGATDIDGNTYQSVIIGNQEWMAENLKTTKYSDGTAIPKVTGNTQWSDLSTGAWCYYDNDSSQYEELNYGKLYNFYAVETDKLCPTGWHVPTDGEWTVLTDYLATSGHTEAEGTALTATSGWDYDGNGTNNYGWLGLPGGNRALYGDFYDVGYNGYWWSSSKSNTYDAWYSSLSYKNDIVYRSRYDKYYGFSVRCLKD
jgi:uncharacterized protein (TIGR02145 family)